MRDRRDGRDGREAADAAGAADAADAAYQGSPGAFSDDAARVMVGPFARLLACMSLADVFEAVMTGRARAAVVPIENSLAGAVPGCAELIARYDVHIVAEHVQPIRHALIARPRVTLSAIRMVWSHPMALAQCQRFLSRHRGMSPVSVFDTAGAVAGVIASRRTDTAAIASRRAAGIHGGVVIADNIQDRADNRTTFLLVRPAHTRTRS